MARSGWWGLLAAFVLGATVMLASPGATAESPAGGVVEVERWLPGPSGGLKRVTLLVDTSVVDPETAMAAAYPEALTEGAVTAQFATFARWSLDDVPVAIGYDSTYDPQGIDGEQLVLAAMETWNSVSGQSFRFAGGGAVGVDTPTCNPNPSDGVNTVLFTHDLFPGILGETCSFYEGTLDGMDRLVEFDLHLSTKMTWSMGPTTPAKAFDLPTVILHELGHGLGLDHAAQGTVMQPILQPGTQLRTPTEDDIEGLRFLYGESPTPVTSTPATSTPPPGPATPTPPPDPAYRVTFGAVARD